MRRMPGLLLLCPMILTLLGCSGSNHSYAPVTGKVTLNGKPLPGASVEFQPIPPSKDVDPGSGSMAVTDSEGRFTLKSQLEDKQGAIVGKHQVRIFVYTENVPGEERDADSADKKHKGPLIPERYNSKSELTVEVPASGITDHHFELKTP